MRGCKKKRNEVQREHRARSVFRLERNPSGTGERRREGFRGAEEESILLSSHASWRRGRTRRRREREPELGGRVRQGTEH